MAGPSGEYDSVLAQARAPPGVFTAEHEGQQQLVTAPGLLHSQYFVVLKLLAQLLRCYLHNLHRYLEVVYLFNKTQFKFHLSPSYQCAVCIARIDLVNVFHSVFQTLVG